MFSTLRNRFGIPGVISVIALVFAMIGGAYAANNGGSNDGASASAKKSAKKSAKGPRVPRGVKGATGAEGPAGPAGAQGPAGANGNDGANGTNGAAGANGKSAVTGTLAAGQGGCTKGGAYVEVSGEPATKKSLCNGVDGAAGTPGAAGSPWVVGQAPSGATLKGTWGVATHAAAGGEVVPIVASSGVPISVTATTLVVYVPPGGPDPSGGACPSAVNTKDPSVAQGGILCVYAYEASNLSHPGIDPEGGAGAYGSAGGVVTNGTSTGAGPVSARGSWVLTVP